MRHSRSPRFEVPGLRWWIGGLLFASTVINYIDRQTLNVLAPYLKAEYHWTNRDFALIVIAFRVSYAVVQLIGGRLVDVLGTRSGLGIAVAWYSVMAMLTSLANGLGSFCTFRFLLGAGEAANWPAATKAVSEWFPARERGIAVALFDSGSAIGAAVAPVLVVWLFHVFGTWRPAFLITGALGFLWLLAWMATYHRPEDHPHISDSERAMILRGARAELRPWRPTRPGVESRALPADLGRCPGESDSRSILVSGRRLVRPFSGEPRVPPRGHAPGLLDSVPLRGSGELRGRWPVQLLHSSGVECGGREGSSSSSAAH